MSGQNTRPLARLPSCFLGMDAWMASQLNVALTHKVKWVIYVLGLFFDVLLIGVCTTTHWQTSRRLVPEINVCTVFQRWMCVCLNPDALGRFTVSTQIPESVKSDMMSEWRFAFTNCCWYREKCFASGSIFSQYYPLLCLPMFDAGAGKKTNWLHGYLAEAADAIRALDENVKVVLFRLRSITIR